MTVIYDQDSVLIFFFLERLNLPFISSGKLVSCSLFF
jgi:hypothetical protein